MVQSKLRNNYNKNRKYDNWCKYKRQRNLCLNLLWKTKKNFYKALDEKQVSDSKTFWKNVKPVFNDKGVNSSKITLIGKNWCRKDDVRKEIRKLNVKKSSTYGSIPASILKRCVDAYLPYLTDSISYSLIESTFHEEPKHSEVIPVYKKLYPLKKENYRPVSLLPDVSKVFERIIYQK